MKIHRHNTYSTGVMSRDYLDSTSDGINADSTVMMYKLFNVTKYSIHTPCQIVCLQLCSYNTEGFTCYALQHNDRRHSVIMLFSVRAFIGVPTTSVAATKSCHISVINDK